MLQENGILPIDTEPNYKPEDLFMPDYLLPSMMEEAASLPRLSISKLDLQWVQVLGEGWAWPLRGFMREDQYLQSQHFNSVLHDDERVSQSVPVVLAVTTADKERLEGTSAMALYYQGECYGIVRKPEFYAHRKEERAARQFGKCLNLYMRAKIWKICCGGTS